MRLGKQILMNLYRLASHPIRERYRRKAAARFLKVKSERRYGLPRRASRSAAPHDDGAAHASTWAH